MILLSIMMAIGGIDDVWWSIIRWIVAEDRSCRLVSVDILHKVVHYRMAQMGPIMKSG